MICGLMGLFIGIFIGMLLMHCRIQRRKKRTGTAITIQSDLPPMSEVLAEWAAYKDTGVNPDEIAVILQDFEVLEAAARQNPVLFAKASGIPLQDVEELAMCRGIPGRVQREGSACPESTPSWL